MPVPHFQVQRARLRRGGWCAGVAAIATAFWHAPCWLASSVKSRSSCRAVRTSPEPLLTCPLRRLEFHNAAFVGAGYDLVDLRLSSTSGKPLQTTFMLDTGLTTNLLSASILEKLNLSSTAEALEGSSLGGGVKQLRSVLLPSVQLLGGEQRPCFEGVWEGDGWRALCSLDWDAWCKAGEKDGRVSDAIVEYSVLPSPKMTIAQVESLAGQHGFEVVEGRFHDGSFLGKGVSVEPKGFLKVTESYKFRLDGEELLESSSGMRLRRSMRRESLQLQGQCHASCVPFLQEEVARRQGIELGGMLGQIPFHRDYGIDVDPARKRLSVYALAVAREAAESQGLVQLPGIRLGSGLFGVKLLHAPLMRSTAKERLPLPVPAIVDSGATNSILNWAAAEQLLGIKQGDRIARDAPMIRAFGVGGGNIDMPLLTLSLGLVQQSDSTSNHPVQQKDVVHSVPVQVAIGDAEVFTDIVGLSEKGSWPFGLGPKRQRPAALLGQDVLSQQRYMLIASEPAVYIAPDTTSKRTELFEFLGQGDCWDAAGRLLPGFQKLGCSPDEAAVTCLRLPPDTCQGLSVTLTGRLQGLCYLHVPSEHEALLLPHGWHHYKAPKGTELAPVGSAIALTSGEKTAECYRFLASA